MESVAFILNLGMISPNEEIEIIPKHYLSQAKPEHVDKIRSILQRYYETELYISPYEYEQIKQNPINTTTGVQSYIFREISKENWKYYTIRFNGPNTSIQKVGTISLLSEMELNIGFTLIKMSNEPQFGVAMHGTRLFVSLNALSCGGGELINGSIDEAKNIGTLYREYEEHIERVRSNKKFDIGLEKKLALMESLYSLERTSELHILVLFSIIESTITHQPDPKDPYDSITRQVKHKFSLIDGRLENPLPYVKFFNESGKDKIWSQLYAYRSAIVHGSEFDFRSKFQLLKSRENVISFLRLATRSLLRQAMKEPLLINDLKEC